MTFRRILMPSVLVLLAGCAAVGPDYERPALTLPKQFITPLEARGEPVISFDEAAAASDRTWWREMGDPVLGELVDMALRGNLDLRIAASRVREFEARLQSTESQQYPKLEASGGFSRERVTEKGAVPLPLGVAPTNNSFVFGLRASWELDIWGRVRRSDEAAMADLLSSKEDREALVTSLVAQVASTYVQLVALDTDLVLSNERVKLLGKRLALLEKKAAGGSATEVDVTRARAELESATAVLPAKEHEVAKLEYALSSLLGSEPKRLQRGPGLQSLRLPAVPAGLPSELLARRPDIRRAEQNLIAANARIGVARSQYFPTISLTALAGAASANLADLTLRSANTGSLGAGILGTLFDGGRIEGDVKQAEAVRAELVDTYKSVILQSLREVEDAIDWRRKSIERLQGLDRLRATQEKLSVLATRRYQGGSSTLLEVFDAELTVVDGKMAQAQTQRDLMSAGIAMYRALGGGWVAKASETSTASADVK